MASHQRASPGTADLLVAPAGDGLGAERAPKKVERAAERGPGVSLVEVGPEEGQQPVAAVVAAGRIGGEVGEQGEPLGLLEHSPDLPPVGGPKVQDAQRQQLDHEAM